MRRQLVDVGTGRPGEHRHLEHDVGDGRIRRARCRESDPARRAVASDEADRRLVADEAADRRRDADRTATVGRRRERCESGGERRGRTATRSARRAFLVPRDCAIAPKTWLSVNAVQPNAGVFVLPTTIAPAARNRATIVASEVAAGASAYSGDPYVVGSPATSVRSLTRSGIPASGPARRSSSSVSASSSAPSVRSRTTAFRSPFAASIRRNDSSTRSRGETTLSRTAAASCCTPLIVMRPSVAGAPVASVVVTSRVLERDQLVADGIAELGRCTVRLRSAARCSSRSPAVPPAPSIGRMRTEIANASGQISVAVAVTTSDVGAPAARRPGTWSRSMRNSRSSRARVSSRTGHCARYARQASSIHRAMTLGPHRAVRVEFVGRDRVLLRDGPLRHDPTHPRRA